MADTNHAKSKSLTLEMPYVFVEVQDALSVFKINIKAFAMDIDRCYTYICVQNKHKGICHGH